MGMGLQYTNHCRRIQMNNTHIIRHTKSNRLFRTNSINRTIRIQFKGIYDEMPSNFQFSADNGYSTDENTKYLEEKGLDGYISTRKLSIKEKKDNLRENHFKKIISNMIQKLKPISVL